MNIYVGNLNWSMTSDDLYNLFSPFGEVVSAKIITDKFNNNRSKGFGFVEMSDDTAARTAISQLHETEITGRKIVVNESAPRQEGSGGSGGDGGYKKKSTFVEYSKNFIDYINAWHSENKSTLNVTDFTRSVYGLHFYTGMVLIEKRKMKEPVDIRKGEITVGYIEYKAQKKESILKQIKKKIKKI